MEIDHKAAGQKADATIIANLVRDNYSNPAKDAIRRWVTLELLAVQPTLVLDLWGGGRSAEELTAAGLSVLSIDDGRGFPAEIAKPRIKRALTIKAEVGGYRSAWGSAAKYAPECDAAWIDFMGHLCGDTIRILRACRHMKALAITLMPARMAGVQNLPIDTWAAMYRAAIEYHTGMKMRHMVRRYRREGGQWALVLWMQIPRPEVRPDSPERKTARRTARRRALWIDPESRERAQRRVRMTDPEHRERRNAWERAWMADPKHRERRNALRRARMADPKVRERRNELRNARRRAMRNGLRKEGLL
jgi:hypothetical protein